MAEFIFVWANGSFKDRPCIVSWVYLYVIFVAVWLWLQKLDLFVWYFLIYYVNKSKTINQHGHNLILIWVLNVTTDGLVLKPKYFGRES